MNGEFTAEGAGKDNMKNIQVCKKEDGKHWIRVRTEDDKYGAICIESIIKGPLTREAFCKWIDERIEDKEAGNLIS